MKSDSMKNQKGFIQISALVIIIAGILILGVGSFLFVSENNQGSKNMVTKEALLSAFGKGGPIRQGEISALECRTKILNALSGTCSSSGLKDIKNILDPKVLPMGGISESECRDLTNRISKEYCEEGDSDPFETEPPVVEPPIENEPPVTETLSLGKAIEVSCTDKACSKAHCNSGDFRCTQLKVSCNGVDDEDAILRISGEGSAGTVVLYTGGPGMAFFGIPHKTENGEPSKEALDLYMNTLKNEGFQLVEVGWEIPGPWGIQNKGDAGSRTLACRPATAMFWVYDNLYKGGLFAAQGNSGGSAQTAFSLTYYGADKILDVVNLGGGPPLCPIITDGKTNGSENDTYCHQGPEGNFGGLEFINEPLLSGNPLLNYSDTKVNFFVGKNEPNSIVHEENNLYFQAVESEKTFTWLENTWHPTHFSIEGATATYQAILGRYAELYK